MVRTVFCCLDLPEQLVRKSIRPLLCLIIREGPKLRLLATAWRCMVADEPTDSSLSDLETGLETREARLYCHSLALEKSAICRPRGHVKPPPMVCLYPPPGGLRSRLVVIGCPTSLHLPPNTRALLCTLPAHACRVLVGSCTWVDCPACRHARLDLAADEMAAWTHSRNFRSMTPCCAKRVDFAIAHPLANGISYFNSCDRPTQLPAYVRETFGLAADMAGRPSALTSPAHSVRFIPPACRRRRTALL